MAVQRPLRPFSSLSGAGWMNKVLSSEFARSLLLALILIGIAMTAFGVVQYVRLTGEINANVAYQINSRGQEINPQTLAEGQMLMAAGMELRELDHQRDISLIVGGGGLILIALGALGRELGAPGKKAAPTT
jgi:hypothetical protein